MKCKLIEGLGEYIKRVDLGTCKCTFNVRGHSTELVGPCCWVLSMKESFGLLALFASLLVL